MQPTWKQQAEAAKAAAEAQDEVDGQRFRNVVTTNAKAPTVLSTERVKCACGANWQEPFEFCPSCGKRLPRPVEPETDEVDSTRFRSLERRVS